MEMENVTNEMLYELIRDFKADMNNFKSDVSRRFEDVRREISELRDEVRENRHKIDKLYEMRDGVTVSFSRAFAGINLVLSGLVSGIVSFFVSR